MWFMLTLLVLSIVLSAALAPKQQKPTPSTLADFDIPTASEGRAIPIIFGTVKFESPNNVWYGDLRSDAIRK